MFRFHLIRNLKSAVWLVAVALIPIALGTLYWANKTGLPDNLRKAIEQEISKHGAHVEIASLTYIPFRGFVAEYVRVFAEAEKTHEISRLERVQLVLDNAKLASGQFRLKKIQLKNALLSLPVDPKNPSGESLRFSGIYGTIFMPGDRLIEIRDARAQVGGINVFLNAKLLGIDRRSKKKPDQNEGRRREMIANILNELEHWNFDSPSPPTLHIAVEGDLTDRETFKMDFHVEAPSVEKNQYRLDQFKARGSLKGNLLTFDSFSAEDSLGSLSGHADYQLESRDGRFDISSDIDVRSLLKSWLSAPLNLALLTGGRQKIQSAGDFNLSDLASPIVHLTGHAMCESVKFRGVSFDTLETWFSWQNGNLFLRDLVLSRPDGTAKGKALVEGNIVRIALHSTLPAPLYKPFFTGQPLEKIIGDFSENKKPSTDVHLVGSFNLKDRFDWFYNGHGTVKNLSYKGVPVNSAQCSFTLSHHELDFYDGSVTFNYRDYRLRNAFGGPSAGTAKVARIRYDAALKAVQVEAVSGDIWAAPLIRFFAPKIADDLEKYRFHRPPAMEGSGLVDVTPKGRTNLRVKFSTTDNADYEFLGKNLTLSQPEAIVAIKGDEVKISELSFQAFGGPVVGELIHKGKSGLSGELSWSRLSMSALSEAYGFNMKGSGKVTGRIDFSIIGGDISTMQGDGLVALENAELFSVPIFGPLSPVMASVLNDKRAGFQRAKYAFLNFKIQDGILRTRDFQTATSSLTFTGNGEIDLTRQIIDLTIRVNARGFLGLITLPLRPFYGLFQFRGTGPLKKTTWENVHFTSPPEAETDILLAEPPKARIVAE
ncbi:MAG: hypothetical protein H7Y36_02030 [Armatimonadetes bacterium]|nr:hypothetical protein [Akkermansiaceae bacterium]